MLLLAVAPLARAEQTKAAAAPATNIAKPAPVSLTGKVMSRMEKKDGKDMTTYEIMISEARDAKMANLSQLDHRTLSVTGPKASQLENYKDKEVALTGTLSADSKSIELATVTPKPSGVTSAAKPAPAPAPATTPSAK